MQLASLGSGSKGNATVIRCAGTCVLIDCGFSLRQIEKRLAKLSMSISDIDAVFLSHEHSDHSRGVERLVEKYHLPFYMTVGTARALRIQQYQVIKGGHVESLGDLQIFSVTVPHDAAEPVQFVITEVSTGRKLGLLTDSGHITNHMRQAYEGCNGLMLEFNYDEQMLEDGPYPMHLKRRIAGNHGHLSNYQSVELLRQLKIDQQGCLIVAHISEKNNSPQRVENLLKEESIHHAPVMACQIEGFHWRQL